MKCHNHSITMFPIEKRQRHLSMKRTNRIVLAPIQYKTLLSEENQFHCQIFKPKLSDSRKTLHRISSNTNNHTSMISYHYKYGFSLSDEDGSTNSEVTDDSEKRVLAAFGQRKHVVKELVKTQIDFTTDMKTVLLVFNSITMQVNESDRYALLGNLDQLVRVNDNISMLLQQEIDEYPDNQVGNACVGKCMLSSKSSINEALKTYIVNFSVDASTKSPEVQKFAMLGFKRLQIERPNIMSLNDELIKPVQRLVKLKQLFELLKDVTPISHPDCAATMEMFDNFNELAYDVNEVKRWKDLCISASDETNKTSIMDMVDKTTKRILTKVARTCSAEVNRKLQVQQKFTAERETINQLEKSCTLLRNAVESRYKKMQSVIIAQRDFVSQLKEIFTQNNRLQLHSEIPILTNSPNCCFPMELIEDYETALNSLIIHMQETYMRRLSSSVTSRLDELNQLLNHAKRLLQKYDSTELDILLLDASVKHQNQKSSQFVAAIHEQKEESVRTLSTLQSGLENMLPNFIKHSNNILQSVCQYSYILHGNIMQEFGNLLQKCIQEYESNHPERQTDQKISPAEFINRIDELKSLLPDRKSRRSRRANESSSSIPKIDQLQSDEKASTLLQEIASLSLYNRDSNSSTDYRSRKTSSKENIRRDTLDPVSTQKLYNFTQSYMLLYQTIS
uniref:DH domain-containing protein n=1 Tax=Trichobilharzia regenti TaxID=157069 RepID=A0AA85K013_TRIRE|nr:unnamed protein product [Trichobilharzia regenti]